MIARSKRSHVWILGGALGVLTLATFPISCATVSTMTSDPKRGVKDIWANIKNSRRSAGEKSLDNPDEVWAEHACDQKDLPYLVLDSDEVSPDHVRAGEEFNQHLVYVMCPSAPAGVIVGDLYTAIYYQGQIVYSEVEKNFVVKPGKWSVDAFIRVPPESVPGVYSIQAEFKSAQRGFRSSKSLIVDAPRAALPTALRVATCGAAPLADREGVALDTIT